MGRRSKSSKGKKPKRAGKARPEIEKRQPEAPEGMPPMDGTPLRWWWLSVLLIALAVVTVYQATLENEFLTFDDRKYIYENEFVIGDGGLGAIWGDLDNPKPRLHFNPMTYTTFWIEHQLVGLEPPDVDPDQVWARAAHPLYHWTQMILHAINVCLLLFALRSVGLRFPVVLFAAAFFALHPVNVAAVAWMAERKTLVSALFMWLAFLLYVYNRRRKPGSPPWRYMAAIGVFALALVSKGAVAVLAPVLIVTDRVLDRRWSWVSAARAAPFFAMGLMMANIISTREGFIAKSWVPIAVHLRPFIAVSALVHYVVKMLVPIKQAIIYPRWAETLSNPRYWISLAVVAAAAYLIRRYRSWLGDFWLWGLALFLLTVAPILGLKHFIWMQFAFVSDHYMYYGGIGVLLMVGLLLERWCRAGDVKKRMAIVGAVCLLALAFCAWRSVQQCRTWKNNATLWTHTLSVAPDCALANGNLGNSYYRHGMFEEALERYEHWITIEPNFARARRSCARAAKQLGREELALAHYREAVRIANAKEPRSWSIRGEYADYLFSLKRYPEALREYESVLQRNPRNREAIEQRVRRLRQALGQAPR
jgi:tetratricopeptide (TPR) repeat protein